MRGIAAVQVVLLHYATAFLPGLGLHDRAMMHHRWERIIADTPLFFVLNGYGSVYLFFLLSGVVLTYSFARRPFVAVQWTLRRIIRLGLPMCGAILLGGILISTWPTALSRRHSSPGRPPGLARYRPGRRRQRWRSTR